MDVIDRFLQKVKINRISGCWEWTASLTRQGYGQFWVVDTNMPSHRVSYMLFRGNPGDLCVCHECDNPKCVNPFHLWLGTSEENNKDRDMKGRQASGLRNARYTHPETTARGSRHGVAKLNEQIVSSVRAEYRLGNVGQRELAKRYGVGKTTIARVVRNEYWRHVTEPSNANA